MATTTRPYVYPPRTSNVIPIGQYDLFKQLGFIAQLKYNDSHLELDYDGSVYVDSYDRHKGHLAYDFSRVREDLDQFGQMLASHTVCLEEPGNGRYLIDGGLLHSKHAAVKDMLVIWDILIANGKQLIGTTYNDRYQALRNMFPADAPLFEHKGQPLGRLLTPRIILPTIYQADEFDKAWDVVNAINKHYPTPLVEGIMLKNPLGKLGYGFMENSPCDWMVKSRVKTGRHKF